MDKCIWCEAFKKTPLKVWESRKCFICWKINIKQSENDWIEHLKNIFWFK